MSNFNHFVISSQKSKAKTNIFLAKPTLAEQEKLGQLFVLTQARYINPKNEEILEAINNIIDQEYYHSAQTENFELTFEHALSELNKRIQPHLSNLPDEWFEQLDMVIAAVKQGMLVFTNIGKINAFLIFRGKIINIIEPSQEKINPLKIFSSTSSGQLPPESLAFFSTESVLDYFSQEKIKKTLEENSPVDGLKYLENILQEQNGTSNFAALALSAPDQEYAPTSTRIESAGEAAAVASGVKAVDDNDSMAHLIEKEAKTKELLAPSIWPALKKGIGNLKTKTKEKIGKPQDKTDPQEKLPVRTERSKSANAAITVLVVIKNLFIKAISTLVVGLRKLFKGAKSGSAKKSIEELPTRTTGGFSKIVVKFKKLSAARKVLLILALVLVILFAWSITGIGQRREKALQEVSYQETLDQVETKINEAKNALLYENEEGARELLTEASGLLAQVPDDKEWTEVKDAKQAAISEQFKTVSHVITVEDPNIVLDYNSIDPAINLNKILLLDNLMYSFDTNNHSVYQADLSDNSTTTASSSTKDGEPLAVDDINTGNLAILYDNNKLYNYSTSSQESEKIEIDFENQDIELKDINAFSSRIYTLDSKNKQIFKHSKSGDGYATGTSWLSDGVEKMANATSMAIDGSIYVLYSDGSIDKFNGGNIDTEFNSPNLEPSLANATKIYTDEEKSYLYVLDPNNKRIVLLEKSGALINQYFSEKFNNLLDFSIDEENKSVYLLNGTQLLKIDI